MLRGLIFYENLLPGKLPIGCLPSNRPVLVVTDQPRHDGMVTVLPLTLDCNDNDIYHVPIDTRDGHCYAIVEQMRSVPVKVLSHSPKDRIIDSDMDKVERAILSHLGFDWEEDAG